MDVRWLDRTHPDPRDVAGALAVQEGARRVDAPHQNERLASSFLAALSHGWEGTPSAIAVVREDGGRVLATLEIDDPQWDNTHLSFVEITVDPVERRRGLGRGLLDMAMERMREGGRRLVLTEAWDGSAGEGFLDHLGFDRASDGLLRRQELPTLDRPRLDEVYRAALARAGSYELVRVPRPLPDGLVGDIATLTAAINDAPIDGLDVEDEVFTPERIRNFEVAQLARGRRVYRLLARERATGALAGHTVVSVECERPWQGGQLDTSVLRAHRGHQLGVLLKVGMLRWLADDEPQVRTLETWNAESNAHMIAVNELLGYRVVARAAEWQRKL